MGNEATDVLAKKAAEGVPPDDHEKLMSGGGIRQWAKQRKRRYLEKDGLGGDGRAVIGRAMKWKRKAVTNYCQLRRGKGIGRWWDDNLKIGRVEGAECPKFGEEQQTRTGPDSEGLGPWPRHRYILHESIELKKKKKRVARCVED